VLLHAGVLRVGPEPELGERPHAVASPERRDAAANLHHVAGQDQAEDRLPRATDPDEEPERNLDGQR
jgi:hypothetical protein